ncbi:HAD family phosphatase [Candidatus Uhrbacteria bacterium]|nr:HAD family phosphatase [Candidatus Uhrbacteria bacterium]
MNHAVLFDWDNLLVPTHESWLRANQETFARHDRQLDEKTFLQLGGGTKLADLLRELDLDLALTDVIQHERNSVYDVLLEESEWETGAQELLDVLKVRQVLLGVVTSARRQNMNVMTRRLDASRFFLSNTIICREDVADRIKPDPHGLQLGAGRLGVPAENSFYLGDLKADMEASKNAGMKGILVKNKLTQSDAHTHAVAVYASLTECRERLDEWLK